MSKKWKTYEEVAKYLLDQFAKEFELGYFEGKQIISGQSGSNWEIDAKGCMDNQEKYLVVECKRYTKTAINQAITASLAWVIQDVGASGGILVSPLGLQEGAKKVAASANIIEVKLDPTSTTTEYMLEFLNKVCIGFSDTVGLDIKEEFSITLIDKDGNIIDSYKD